MAHSLFTWRKMKHYNFIHPVMAVCLPVMIILLDYNIIIIIAASSNGIISLLVVCNTYFKCLLMTEISTFAPLSTTLSSHLFV